MILRIFTFCFTYLSVFFLLIPAGVAGEDAGSKTGASYFLSMTENSLLPERNSAYVGTRVYVLSDPEAWLEVATETSPLQWFDELVMDLPILGNHDPDYASVINPETSFKEGMVMSCDAFLANIDDALVSGPDPSTPFVETADVFGNTGSFNCGTENAYPSPILSTEQSNGFGTAFCPAPTPMILRGTDESYQVVVGGNFTVPSQGGAEIEGRAAIGGNLDVNRIFGLGESGGGTFVVSEPGEYLQVGGNVTGTGPINTGTNTATGPGQNTALIGGTNAATINSATVQQGATLTFDIAQQLAEMSNASMGMSIATPTGSFAGGVLTGTNAALEIFNITAADVSSSVLTFADIAPGATIVVNVSGAGAINFAGSRNGRVNDPQSGSSDPDALVYNVVWNFYETTGVVTVNPNVTSGIHGLVLIPNGNLTLNTNLNGRLFVGGDVTFSSPTAFGPEIHNYPFTGDLSSFCGGAGMCDVTAIAFAIQASCDSDGNIASDGYLQISATDGLSYEVNLGSTNDGTGTRTTLVGESYPLQIQTGLANPVTDQDYTIRVYAEDEGGASDCFTDVVVTLRVQDCTISCECEEYIYLNETTGGGKVHKFGVSPTGDLTEIFVGGNAWYPGNNPVSELTAPHGLGTDLNGFVYIGETTNGDIRKLTCEGELFPETGTDDAFVINDGGFNIATFENRLFVNRNVDGVREYDLCTGNLAGSYILAESPGDTDWGMTISGSTLYVARAFLSGSNRVYRFDIETTPLGATIQPLISEGTQAVGTLAVGDDFLPRTSLYGIDVDPAGNIYLAENDRENEIASSPQRSGRILKYSPDGVLLAMSDWDTVEGSIYPGETDPNNRGFFNASGIVYSEASDRLYVSTQSPTDDCVALMDPNTLEYLGAAVPFTNSTSQAKGIAILKECCPSNNRVVIDTLVCNTTIGDKLFLQELINCDGTICSGVWDTLDTNTGLMYDGCDNSLTITSDIGCGTFTLDFDGTGTNPQCGAFTITINVAIGEVQAAIVGEDQEICEGEDPAAFTILSAASANAPLTYQWLTSTESDSTGFVVIPGAIMETYDPSPTDLTADTVYFQQVASIEGCNGGMCADTSNTVIVITQTDCCELEFTDIVTDCTYDPMTGSSYEVTVSIGWFSPVLTTTNDNITVTFAGQTMSIDAMGMVADTQTVVFANVSGPAYDQLLTATFANDANCTLSTPINLIACTPDCVDGPGTVGGNVFNDFNNDGADAGAGEVGQENVLVEVYDCDGMLVCSTYTNADGNWTCDGLNDSEEYRVEFSTPLQPYLQPSFAGDDNGTNTQFVTAPSCEVDYGVINPSDYCEDDPELVTICYVLGDIASTQTEPVLISVLTSEAMNTGTEDDAFSEDHNVNVPNQTLGSAWGIAYDKTTERIFVAASVKTQTELGPGGLGAIYVADNSTNSGINTVTTASQWLDLAAVPGIDIGADPFATEPFSTAFNREVFSTLGKVGLGDVVLADDGEDFFAVNLNSRSVIQVPIDAAGDAVVADITDVALPEVGSCTDVLRPWAIKYYEGRVYVGAVCTGEAANADVDDRASLDGSMLRAYVFQYDPETKTFFNQPIIDFPLEYDRSWTDIELPAAWQPWADRWVYDLWLTTPRPNGTDFRISYPQPILSDIEIDGCFMYLGFMDRFGSQFGRGPAPDSELSDGSFVPKPSPVDEVFVIPGGDILMAGLQANGTWAVENDGVVMSVCGDRSSQTSNADPQDRRSSLPAPYDAADPASGINAGPGGREFIWGDYYGTAHNEVTIGGLTLIPGSGEIISTAYDPIQHVSGAFSTGGLMWFSTEDDGGGYTRGVKLYEQGNNNFRKGAGFGDVEPMCGTPPVQIGNYAWIDENEDGIQQACEPPLPGVTVKLYRKDGGTPVQIASTETDANGNYYFSSTSATDPNLNWTGTAADTSLQAGEEYFIAFCGDNGFDDSNNTIEIGGATYCLTAADTGEGNNPDLNDSDATVQDILGDMIPAYCTQPGEVDTTNHTFDVGFKPVITCDLSIVAVTPVCAYNAADGQSTFTVTVEVAWDYADLATTNELINVTFAGQTLTINPANAPMSTGTPSVVFNNVAGPAYEQLVEAEFATTASCSATSPINLIACTPDCVDGPGTVGGNVFNDFNNDGADAGAGEVGQENVLVEVYDCDGVLVCSTYTNADGNWSCAGLNDAEEYRVEFSTPLQPYLQPSFAGDDNGTDVQFVTAPSCEVDYGVIVANEYCEDNPLIIVPCYFSGPQDNNLPALVGVYYNEPDAANPSEVGLVNDSDIGTTYGVAYQPREGLIYASAMTRHFFDYGPGGFDAIYAIDFTDDNGSAAPAPVASVASTINLASLGVNMGTTPRTTPLSGNAPYNDGDVYQSVGKVGIGDIDISADGDTLFVINLNEAAPSLVLLDISDPSSVSLISEVPIPDPGCVGGSFAPWGARYYNGELYIGGVCTAEGSGDVADLEAFVYRYDGAFTEVLNVPLDYDRSAATYRSDNTFSNADWRPWTDTWNPDVLPLGAGDLVSQPMPILQDIEFNDNGDMILGFGDRFTYQTAFGNRQPGQTSGPVFTPVGAGDILQVCYENGVYNVEGNGGCPQPVTDLGSTNVPAIPTIVEYFDDNYINEFNTQAGHAETALGGLTTVSGKGEILMVGFDPRRNRGNVNTSGIRFMGNDGTSGKGWEIVAENDPSANRKGGSLGDAEALCGPLPIQIGNYVWLDEDEDGVQDACEDPVPEGLPVTLYTKDDDGTLTEVATTTTGPNGEYYFTGDGTTGETWTTTDDVVLPDTTYLIVFGDMPESDTSFVYNNTEYGITQDSTGEGNSPGLNDSDGVFTDVNGNLLPAICYSTADTTDHTLDVGLVPLAVFDLALIKTLDLNTNPGPFSPGSTVDFNITVYNQGDTDATDVEVKDYIPEGLSLAPASAPNWTVSVDTAILTTPFSLAAGEDSVLNISFVIDVDFMSDTLTNRAEISNFDDDNDPNTDPPVDEDSTPDDNGDDPAEVNTPDEIDDDGDGTPGTEDDPNDEDDYDWEGIPVLQSFDLNLVKRVDTITTPGPFTYGSTVAYTIEVRNQGSLDATDVEVADYVPDGLTLVADANWMLDVDTARTTAAYAVAAGDTLTLSISFTIDLDFSGTGIVNTAEITDAMNALGRPDEDSNPGDNGGDDPEFDTDDEDNDDGPNGNGNPDDPADSDDFDLARLSIETVSLGSTVFLDNNNDGLQNGADMGIANVEVQLFDAATMMEVFTDASGTRVLTAGESAPTLTDTDGNYLFDNLLPGDYYVVIPEDAVPTTAPVSSNNTGIAFTETDPDDNLDNDDEGLQTGGSGASVSSNTITLALGDEPENGTADGTETAQGNMQDDAFDSNGNMTVDFGFFAPVAVGDTAFVDLDGDGLQMPGEPGIGGVTVALLDSNGDTVMVDADGMMITGLTMTAADGSYLFDNLPPGSYSVVFDISTADNEEFYDFTTPNAGNDADDSDNSIALSDSTAQSDPTPFLNSGEQDLSLDVGVVCALEVTVAEPFTICATQTIDLTTDVTITPDTSATFGATWTTPDGTGDFLDAAGNVLTAPFGYDTAITYRPAAADALRGSVTLILTTDDPAGPCEPVSDSVTIEVLKVDCGQFMWDGSND